MPGKPIIEETPPSVNRGVNFQKAEDFNELVKSKSYEIYLDKAMRCPCVGRMTNQALSSCKNCGGLGWFFVDRKKTYAVLQRMNSSPKQFQWSEQDMGTSSISTIPENRLSYMDRITVLPLLAFYNEVVFATEVGGSKLFAYTIFESVELTDVYLFSETDQKHIKIPAAAWTISSNKIVFDRSKFSSPQAQEYKFTVRYSHHPVYHVIDITRDVINAKQGNCEGTTQRKDLPMNAVGRKANFITDYEKIDGARLYENTVIEE